MTQHRVHVRRAIAASTLSASFAFSGCTLSPPPKPGGSPIPLSLANVRVSQIARDHSGHHGAGSAVLIGPGLYLTCNHAVWPLPGAQLSIDGVPRSFTPRYGGDPTSTDFSQDWLIFETDPEVGTTSVDVAVDFSCPVPVGTQVYLIGYPKVFDGRITADQVRTLPRVAVSGRIIPSLNEDPADSFRVRIPEDVDPHGLSGGAAVFRANDRWIIFGTVVAGTTATFLSPWHVEEWREALVIRPPAAVELPPSVRQR